MEKVKPPCFDVTTRTDCPRRKAGCAIDCPDWAKYTKERDEVYRQRALENEAMQVMYTSRYKSSDNFKRRFIRRRQNHKGKIM